MKRIFFVIAMLLFLGNVYAQAPYVQLQPQIGVPYQSLPPVPIYQYQQAPVAQPITTEQSIIQAQQATIQMQQATIQMLQMQQPKVAPPASVPAPVSKQPSVVTQPRRSIGGVYIATRVSYSFADYDKIVAPLVADASLSVGSDRHSSGGSAAKPFTGEIWGTAVVLGYDFMAYSRLPVGLRTDVEYTFKMPEHSAVSMMSYLGSFYLDLKPVSWFKPYISASFGGTSFVRMKSVAGRSDSDIVDFSGSSISASTWAVGAGVSIRVLVLDLEIGYRYFKMESKSAMADSHDIIAGLRLTF